MIYEYSIETTKENFYNITSKVGDALLKSGVRDGICVVFCPHTTAAVTINENTDPNVVTDLLLGLDKAFPDRPEFKHFEENSSAHLKSSAIGSSVTLLVENGKPLLGKWQGIFFCEFDGPRTRNFFVKVIGS